MKRTSGIERICKMIGNNNIVRIIPPAISNIFYPLPIPFPKKTSFFDRVLRVFFWSSDPQMRGSDTGWNIACMTDKFSFRNFAIMKFIREPMGRIMLFRLKFNSPVPSSSKIAFPNPACGSFFYKFPKAYFRRRFRSSFEIFNRTWATMLICFFDWSLTISTIIGEISFSHIESIPRS